MKQRIGKAFLVCIVMHFLACHEGRSSNHDIEESVRIIDGDEMTSCCCCCCPHKRYPLILEPNPEENNYGTLSFKKDDETTESLIGCCCCKTTGNPREGEDLTTCQSCYRKFCDFMSKPCHPLMAIPGLAVLGGLGYLVYYLWSHYG